MGYGQSIVRGFKSFILDKQAMTELANDEDATLHGFLTLVLTGLLFALFFFLGAQFLGFLLSGAPDGAELQGVFNIIGLASFIVFPIIIVVSEIICVSIFHLLAKLFGGAATWTQFFRAGANPTVIYWPFALVLMIPYIGGMISFLLSIWFIVVLVVIVREVHKLSTGKAVAVVLIPVALAFIVAVAFVATLLMAILGAGM